MLFDAVIVSSGFESRASYQAKQLDFLTADKIALCFDSETDDETRKINDSYFLKSGFEIPSSAEAITISMYCSKPHLSSRSFVPRA